MWLFSTNKDFNDRVFRSIYISKLFSVSLSDSLTHYPPNDTLQDVTSSGSKTKLGRDLIFFLLFCSWSKSCFLSFFPLGQDFVFFFFSLFESFIFLFFFFKLFFNKFPPFWLREHLYDRPIPYNPSLPPSHAIPILSRNKHCSAYQGLLALFNQF